MSNVKTDIEMDPQVSSVSHRGQLSTEMDSILEICFQIQINSIQSTSFVFPWQYARQPEFRLIDHRVKITKYMEENRISQAISVKISNPL